jgi:hypothetical protein
LRGAVGVGRHVLHERRRSTVIEEVDGHSHAATRVGGCETAIEVGEKVDGGAIVRAVGEDPGNRDADVWLGVCEASVEGPRAEGERERGVGHIQLPMTAVLTTSVSKVSWLAAVLFFSRAVV